MFDAIIIDEQHFWQKIENKFFRYYSERQTWQIKPFTQVKHHT